MSMAAAAPAAAATAASVELPSPLVLVCMTYKRDQRTNMPVFSVSLNAFAPPCMFARSTVPIRQVMNSSPCAMIPLYVCILSIFSEPVAIATEDGGQGQWRDRLVWTTSGPGRWCYSLGHAASPDLCCSCSALLTSHLQAAAYSQLSALADTPIHRSLSMPSCRMTLALGQAKLMPVLLCKGMPACGQSTRSLIRRQTTSSKRCPTLCHALRYPA